MWAQSWVSIVDLVLPFPRKPLRTSRRSWKARSVLSLPLPPPTLCPWAGPHALPLSHSAGSWRKCSKRLKNSSPPWGCFPLLLSSGNNQCLERPTDGWEVECTPLHGTSMTARTSGAHPVASTPPPAPPILPPPLSTCLPVLGGGHRVGQGWSQEEQGT